MPDILSSVSFGTVTCATPPQPTHACHLSRRFSVRSSGMYFPSVTTGASHLPAALCPLLCGYFFPSQLVAFFDGYSITTAILFVKGAKRSPDLFPVPPRPPLKWPVYRTVHSEDGRHGLLPSKRIPDVDLLHLTAVSKGLCS